MRTIKRNFNWRWNQGTSRGARGYLIIIEKSAFTNKDNQTYNQLASRDHRSPQKQSE